MVASPRKDISVRRSGSRMTGRRKRSQEIRITVTQPNPMMSRLAPVMLAMA